MLAIIYKRGEGDEELSLIYQSQLKINLYIGAKVDFSNAANPKGWLL
jgi:hypothetical protein